MFRGELHRESTFHQDISRWNVHQVQDMVCAAAAAAVVVVVVPEKKTSPLNSYSTLHFPSLCKELHVFLCHPFQSKYRELGCRKCTKHGAYGDTGDDGGVCLDETNCIPLSRSAKCFPMPPNSIKILVDGMSNM
mmetsp:Transcript_12625/g.29300  ORF Transcript_12625/g.29300 Transcript_12625/m.29300 type:complete len:134 (-) Transcript_12625:67-468(-)